MNDQEAMNSVAVELLSQQRQHNKHLFIALIISIVINIAIVIAFLILSMSPNGSMLLRAPPQKQL